MRPVYNTDGAIQQIQWLRWASAHALHVVLLAHLWGHEGHSLLALGKVQNWKGTHIHRFGHSWTNVCMYIYIYMYICVYIYIYIRSIKSNSIIYKIVQYLVVMLVSFCSIEIGWKPFGLKFRRLRVQCGSATPMWSGKGFAKTCCGRILVVGSWC